MGIERVDQAAVGGDDAVVLVRIDVLLAAVAIAAGVFVPAHPRARHQRQRVGQAEAADAVDARLLHLHDGGRAAVGVIAHPVIGGLRHMMIRVPHVHGAIQAIQRKIVLAGELVDAGADAHRMLAAQRFEGAVHLQIQRLVARGHVEQARVQHGTQARLRVHGAFRERVLRVVGFLRGRARQLERPVLVEAVRQFGKDGGLLAIPAVPVLAQRGRPLQADVVAIAVVGQAVEEGGGTQFLVADAAGQRGVRAEVIAEHAVQHAGAALRFVVEVVTVVVAGHAAGAQGAGLVQRRAGVDVGAVVVPRAAAGQHLHLGLGERALAHQVDGRAGRAGALQQARGAADDFHAVQRHGLGGEAVGLGVVERAVHAVELIAVHAKTARIHVAAAHRALVERHTGAVGQHVVQRVGVLVVHALARDHADRLRNFLERLAALADGHHAARVAARALGDRIVGHAGHGHRRQRGHPRRVLRHAPQLIAFAVGVGHCLQARARKQPGKSLLGRVPARQSLRPHAARQRWRGRHRDLGSNAKLTQRHVQRGGCDGEGNLAGGRGLRPRRGRGGQRGGCRQGKVDGKAQTHAR